MIVLVPSWAHHYDEFWKAIRSRNLWFIKMRYAFAAALLLFLLGGECLLNFSLSTRQIYAITALSLIILLYNIFLHYIRGKIGCIPGKFNCLHLSLVQMLCDLISLLILIYYTGTIESPMYLFGIFQAIIGSLILPGYVVYSVIAIYLIVFNSMVMLQYFNVIHTHLIWGLYSSEVVHPFTYVILFMVIYSTMILISVYLANKIAYQLYKREQQLRSSLEKIEQLEEKKQKYIIGVVHEIKTPVSAIQSFANILLDDYVGPIPEKVKEKIERIKARSSDALSLVNNVLYISRLKLLNLTSFEPIDIVSVIESILEKQCSDLKSKKIETKVIDQRKFKKQLMADKILLELAISNIIGNAFKYTKEKGTVQIELNDDENNISIEVSDTGIGIPGSELQNVLNEFYRASNAKRSDFEGSGLGLALVKEVIERHKGTIRIDSPSKIGTIENPGTVVVIQLPYDSPLTNDTQKN